MRRSAGAILSYVAAALLALVADASASPNVSVVRILVAGAVLAGVYLAVTSRWAVSRWPALAAIPGASRDQATQERTLSDEPKVNVTSHHQSGGITAGTVNISAPQPSVQTRELSSNEKIGDGYQTRIALHLDAPYAAQNLGVRVRGSSITKLDVQLTKSGMISTRQSALTEGGGVFIVEAPLVSDYVADIVTERPDELTVEVGVNV